MKQTSSFFDCCNAFIDFIVCDCSLKRPIIKALKFDVHGHSGREEHGKNAWSIPIYYAISG